MAIKVGSGFIKNGLNLLIDPADTTQYTLSEVEVLVVAGGGGGAGGWGNGGGAGGGGGGGVLYSSVYPVTPGSAIAVTVGSGGIRGVGSTQAGLTNAAAGGKGNNSVFGILTAIGGGGGANSGITASNINGGSGGGGGYVGQKQGGLGTDGQGTNGGNHSTQPTDLSWYGGGGGGGAGTPGRNGFALNRSQSTVRGGDGGDGLGFWISGSYKVYGGGGGGSTYNAGVGGQGGAGGGGNGGNGNTAPGTPGVDGTNGLGGGGGAGGEPSSSVNVGGNGGKGGDGVVIVRYPGARKANGGDYVVTIDGHTIHTFLSSGTFTPLSSGPSNASNSFYGLEDLSGNLNSSEALYYSAPTYFTANGGNLYFSGTNRINIPIKGNPTCYCFQIAIKQNKAVISFPETNFDPYYSCIGISGRTNTGLYTGSGLNIGQWTGGFTGETISWWGPPSQGLSYSATCITDNVTFDWHIYTFNWNGSTYDIWLDGTKRTTYAHSSQGHTNLITNVTAVTLGYVFQWNYWFQGNIGFVNMYDTPLTDSEVLYNYNLQKSRFGL